MRRQTGGMRGTGILGALLLVMLTPATVAADTQLGTHGRTGPHALRDRATLAGATCTWDGGFLDTITVRAPRMRARDVSAACDHQSVRWSIRIDYWDVNEFWATASTAGPWTATAWDDRAASYVDRTIAAPTGLGGEYRVVVVMRWLRGGHVEGRSTHLVDWVRLVTNEPPKVVGPAATCAESLLP